MRSRSEREPQRGPSRETMSQERPAGQMRGPERAGESERGRAGEMNRAQPNEMRRAPQQGAESAGQGRNAAGRGAADQDRAQGTDAEQRNRARAQQPPSTAPNAGGTVGGANQQPNQRNAGERPSPAPQGQAGAPPVQNQGQTGTAQTAPQGQGGTAPPAAGQGQPSTVQGQGSASPGANVAVEGRLNIAPERASRVRDTLVRSGERADVRVDLSLGRALPNTVRLRPVPADIIAVSPELRGYEYTVVEDEVVIVEPRSREVVEVISASGPRSSQMGAAGGSAAPSSSQTSGSQTSGELRTGSVGQRAASIELTLSSRDRDRLRQDLLQDSGQPRLDISMGVQLPTTIEVATIPDAVVSAVPAVRGFQYFVSNDKVVLIDPSSRSIVDVIQ